MATKPLEDALTIIEIIKKKSCAGISELSKELKMNKNKVFRLITTLELKGLVELDRETEKYKLGMNFIKLEHSYIESLEYIKISKPVLRSLKKEINENIYISTLHKKDVIYIYEEIANRQIVVNSRIAKRFKADKTAAGKALKKAKKEKGFLVEKIFTDNEEILEIATIIRDEFYYPLASLSVVAPTYRINSEEKIKYIEEKLVSSAEEITELLAPNFSI